VVSGRLHEALDGVDIGRIVLEMTEHAAVTDYGELTAALRLLRQRGLRVAVDDAGAGYASFRHILRLNPEWIKLDMSITHGVNVDAARAGLAGALVGFAAKTGSRIIAEGVENEDELHTLRNLGVTAAQGYYLGRPTRLGEAIESHATAIC
jgi:EAL domain-containing protein (putative c-di-GMP-specific phosphodiesterase class I)